MNFLVHVFISLRNKAFSIQKDDIVFNLSLKIPQWLREEKKSTVFTPATELSTTRKAKEALTGSSPTSLLHELPATLTRKTFNTTISMKTTTITT